MGRKTKFDERRSSEILSALQKGVSFVVAARRVGVNPKTVHRWIALGRAVTLLGLKCPHCRAAPSAPCVSNTGRRLSKPHAARRAEYERRAPLREFAEEVSKARSEFEAKLAERWFEAVVGDLEAPADWRGIQALLKVRAPRRYADNPTRVQLSGDPAPDATPVEIEATGSPAVVFILPDNGRGDAEPDDRNVEADLAAALGIDTDTDTEEP